MKVTIAKNDLQLPDWWPLDLVSDLVIQKLREELKSLWLDWMSLFRVPLRVDKVNMLTHIYPHKPPKEDWSNHTQSPGLQPTLFAAWCLIWWFASLEKVWSYMTPMFLLRPGVIKQHRTKPSSDWNVTKQHSVQLNFFLQHSKIH